ncbi:MAG: 16S rRNA (cytidine(1402)-2'-O)-methyltransferase [Deltaproteobacteria bacterium]|nr:16S rRNA (cytidine(1402)-2'-O)-methyltransferase [Deltaproteobacteria bacterium]MBW2070935.1 16S rRNA (cytidine(1402)-2'-O)-methyltransferase [Deltaproteobacteria bacterium]
MRSTTGSLFLVATPIGNLEDITLRALRTLREVDIIAAEDTRRTRKLLSFYDIHRPLLSYHDHNAAVQTPHLLAELQAGKAVALVSDAGTPSIADPGFDLVRRAVAAGIQVLAIPGPSALISSLIVSGLPTDKFLFLGYPPSRSAARCAFLARYSHVQETLVLFESPHRLPASLCDMYKIWGSRQVAVTRELTKIHEEVFRGSLEQAVAHWQKPPRGEVTLVVAGVSPEAEKVYDSLEEELRLRLQSTEKPLKEIVAEVALARGLSKRLVYQQALKIRRQDR